MSEESVEYKIQKYTYKLKHAENRKTASHYQDKLQHYHKLNRMNMQGGTNGEELKQQAQEVVSQLSPVVSEMKREVQEKSTKIIKNLSPTMLSFHKKFEKVVPIAYDVKKELSPTIKKIGDHATQIISEGKKEFQNVAPTVSKVTENLQKIMSTIEQGVMNRPNEEAIKNSIKEVNDTINQININTKDLKQQIGKLKEVVRIDVSQSDSVSESLQSLSDIVEKITKQ